MNGSVRKSKKRKVVAIVLAIVITLLALAGGLQLGSLIAEKTWKHWRPTYEKRDILPLLQAETLTDEEYALLYAQTGLTRLGIDDLRARNELGRILDIQDVYFSNYSVRSSGFAPFTYTEYINGTAVLTALQDGDILVSARMRVSFMRFGHSALVVDGANNIIIEAISPGSVSEVATSATFISSANFMVLRPKLSKEKKAELVAFAKQKLVGLPYRATTGIFTKKYDANTVKASHCSHLVWYAYRKFGVDLDATGGLVVTPRDMARSGNVELVQVYGFNPVTLWN